MTSMTLKITLKSDVVLTERNASVGGASSLDYIPGAALLGAAAEQLYREGLSREDAFAMFHSGAVRFGNGVPELDGVPAIPAPLAFHREKRAEEDAPDVTLALVDRESTTQYEQYRSGWVLDAAGDTVRSVRTLSRDRRSTMRTSVDEHGKAREGLLFGIESLAGGQTFVARVDAEDIQHLHNIEAALMGRPIFIGRSRSAEFGEVSIERVQISETAPMERSFNGDRTIFLCASDLALRNRNTGAVRLLPEAADFGLPNGWTLDLKRTFLRTRRYSPFNGHRRRHDLDRQVIAAGSVMVFERNDRAPEVSGQTVVETTRSGVGDFRQDGLGQVYVEPALLKLRSVTFEKPGDPPTATEKAIIDPLAIWLHQRASETRSREEALLEITRDANDFAHFKLRNAQWGWIRTLAQTAQRKPDGAQYLNEQFDRGTRPAPTLREKGSASAQHGGARALRWAVRAGKNSARDFMMSWMKRQPPEQLAIRLEMLAARVVRPGKGENRD